MNAFSDISDILASFIDGLPWPALLVSESGEVTFINHQMKAQGHLPAIQTGAHLSVVCPHFYSALQGTLPWLTPQDVDARNLQTGAQQRISVRRLPLGACMLITERTRVEFDLGSAQTARLASLGFMVAGVCHEVSNPLTAIHSMVQLLQSSGSLQPDTLERGLNNIAANVQRVLNITRRLNDFSRSGIDQKTLLPVSQPVTEALQNTQQHALFHNIAVEQSVEPDLWIMGVADQLEQVIFNILLNAAQAMNGNGRILVAACAKKGARVEISVRDSGPGIAPGHLPRLLEPFFTTKPSGQGTGLGLAICNEIVAEHGGTLRADNHPGGGACFTVMLPAYERRA